MRVSVPTQILSDALPARLTPEVAEVLAECLIAGRTRKSIAELLEVSVRTVDRWKASPLVAAEVERLRSRSDEVRAVDVLIGLMESQDERIALRAAELVIRHKVQRIPEDDEPPAGMRRILVREEPFE